MARTVSISRANKLGDRLRKSDTPSEDDLRLLQDVLKDYADPISAIQRTLKGLGLQSTARFKTSGTIIDKLKRDKGRLSKMQDLVGARVVKDMGTAEQDTTVEQILSAFPGSERDDLRVRPRSGYRAVHVIVPVDDCRAEVQVRTEMQDLWANLVESFESEMGRGIRYGRKPLYPRRRVKGLVLEDTGLAPTQTQLFSELQQLSRQVAALELLARGPTSQRLKREMAQAEKGVKSLFKGILDSRRTETV